MKFKCQCPNSHTGNVCQKPISSCKDVLASSQNSLPRNGVYTITRKDVRVYCAFTAPNQAWTLIESFSLENNKIYYSSKPLNQDWPRNQHSPTNWEDYRMSFVNMEYLRSESTMFRATCDFPNREGNLKTDSMIGNLSDYDVIGNPDGSGKCVPMTYINIRGQAFHNAKVPMYSSVNKWHTHVDCGGVTVCEPKDFSLTDNVASEDCFGLYGAVNTASKCTATLQSTTQWWLGGTI